MFAPKFEPGDWVASARGEPLEAAAQSIALVKTRVNHKTERRNHMSSQSDEDFVAYEEAKGERSGVWIQPPVSAGKDEHGLVDARLGLVSETPTRMGFADVG